MKATMDRIFAEDRDLIDVCIRHENRGEWMCAVFLPFRVLSKYSSAPVGIGMG
jgi:hypothetical protein